MMFAEDPYGGCLVREGRAGLQFIMGGRSSCNARAASTVRLVREVLSLPAIKRPPTGVEAMYVVQFDDWAHTQTRSAAYGRLLGACLVELMPDPYFYFSRGFDDLRSQAISGRLPAWHERLDQLFWRGSNTHNVYSAGGGILRSLADIPRVDACLRLRGHPRADAAISDTWGLMASHANMSDFFAANGIWRSRATMIEHANYRYLLDIDGVSNAWATMERFLCGACVLKVESPFEMWFYKDIVPWVHYVPVKADLSDLEQSLDWCLDNSGRCRQIAHNGQAYALGQTFEAVQASAVQALSACRIPL